MREEQSQRSFTEILAHVRTGDPDAAETLFERLGREQDEGALLLAMARKLLPADDRMRDFIESRDLVQSALRSSWIDLADFRGETPAELLAWLRSILRRKLAQVVRRRRPRTEGGAAERPPDAIGVDEARDEPLTALVRQEVAGRVRAALERLPEHERAVMELRLGGLKSPEIAGRLGLEPEVVRKRSSRAAARLRELLEDDS